MCKNEVGDQQQGDQTQSLMDSDFTTSPSPSVTSPPSSSNDEPQRVKFLCSFLGSILPRPQDGKLRYVGGETRILSVRRDITYDDLMNKMREIYEGAAVLKYQQPDEDLDALVSVVNDDDVTNMMEEYDKLGSGDGVTRLRIFLFPNPDIDCPSPYGELDERDAERRYVDALNNLQQSESPSGTPLEDIHVTDQLLNRLTIETGLHSQRSNASNHLGIPRVGSGLIHQQPITQRYGETDGTWSPANVSPRHHGFHYPRSLAGFPSSPSTVHYQHPAFEHQPHMPENVVWMPTGTIPGDHKGGFPGNVIHGPSSYEGNTICEHCRLAFHRNQQHLELPNLGTGFSPAATPCLDAPGNIEAFMANSDPNLHHGIFSREQNDPWPVYNDTYGPERGWLLQHELIPRREEVRAHISIGGRPNNDHYMADGHAMNFPRGYGNLMDGSSVSSGYVHHRTGPEVASDGFHDQALPVPKHIHISSSEERGVQFGGYSYAQGADNVYSVSHGHLHPQQTMWRNAPSHLPGPPAYDGSSIPQHADAQLNDTANQDFLRIPLESGMRYSVGVDSQNPWAAASPDMLDFKEAPLPERSISLRPTNCINGSPFTPDWNPSLRENLSTHEEPPWLLNPSSTLVHTEFNTDPGQIPDVVEAVRREDNMILQEDKEANQADLIKTSNLSRVSSLKKPQVASYEAVNSKPGEVDLPAPHPAVLSVDGLTYLPELIASAKKAALEGVEEVKALVEENRSEIPNNQEEPELNLDNENSDAFKIEPTKAEAEAISKGLQTIQNDDLEEIRELGSGTYGSVFHGKWKGCDVAIKRIKASCFAGKPSERERLIADFWKEALILSSLHHPNVVSFYGIVRDGPDGSLATVTEFMVNGSLKQFLQKKDRTIDRRKRLIIAMDTAFGMEYLHGKNIVHFDLKCENLLVNMRDPQRPVCKIGDLGLSKVKQQTLVSGGVRGTLPWMAPELLSGKSSMVTEKIDVYSFGIVMWEVLTGEEPYSDMHCASLIGGIVNNTLRPKIPPWCDPQWKSLMESCWASEPADRPSFTEVSQQLRTMAAAINVK